MEHAEREQVDDQEMAEDYAELLDLEQARHENRDDPGIPYEQVRKELGLD